MTDELETIRVFVGTDATQIVAHQVLAYSLRKHTQREVAVYPMRDLPLPTPRDPDNRSRTVFSFIALRFTSVRLPRAGHLPGPGYARVRRHR